MTEKNWRFALWLKYKKQLKVIVVSSIVFVVRMTPETVTPGYVDGAAVQLANQGVGSVPASMGDQVPVGATHPPLAGGHMVGHGGVALKVFVGLKHSQQQQLDHMGQVECPRGRRGHQILVAYLPLELPCFCNTSHWLKVFPRKLMRNSEPCGVYQRFWSNFKIQTSRWIRWRVAKACSGHFECWLPS